MIDIYICEDNSAHLKQFYNSLQTCIEFEELESEMRIVLMTDNPHEIIKMAEESGFKYSFYFLDIDLEHEIDGLELAIQIRKNDLKSKIIFITSHKDLPQTAINANVNPFRYITKDTSTDVHLAITQALRDAFKDTILRAKEGDVFFKRTKDRTLMIPFSDIYYFHKPPYKKHIILETADNSYQFTSTVKALIDQDKGLFPVSQSAVAYLPNAIGFDEEEKLLLFPDNKSVKVSLKYFGMIRGTFN